MEHKMCSEFLLAGKFLLKKKKNKISATNG